MRLRHKPKAVASLPRYPFYLDNSQNFKGQWQSRFDTNQPLSLELGCGFGKFSCEFASRYTNNNLISVDKSRDVLVGGCRLIEETLGPSVPNLRVCSFDAYNIENHLSYEDEVENIFIFFCNPWPKRSHNRRRLTYPELIRRYQKFTTKDAKLYFKTDDKQLYLSSLRYFEECKLPILFKTEHLDDSHGVEFLSIQTEYEQRFRSLGQNIFAAVVSL